MCRDGLGDIAGSSVETLDTKSVRKARFLEHRDELLTRPSEGRHMHIPCDKCPERTAHEAPEQRASIHGFRFDCAIVPAMKQPNKLHKFALLTHEESRRTLLRNNEFACVIRHSLEEITERREFESQFAFLTSKRDEHIFVFFDRSLAGTLRRRESGAIAVLCVRLFACFVQLFLRTLAV